MDQATTVADRLLNACNLARQNGVNLAELFEQGDLSEIDRARLVGQIQKHIARREAWLLANRARAQADRFAATCEEKQAEAEAAPQSVTLRALAKAALQKRDEYNTTAAEAEAALAAIEA